MYKEQLILKNVTIGYSKFVTGDIFEQGDDTLYKGCINLIEDSSYLKDLRDTMKKVCEEAKFKPDKIKELISKKIKKPEKEQYQTDEEGNNLINVWLSSKFRPTIYISDKEEVNQNKVYKPKDELPEGLNICGGDLVNMLITIIAWPPKSKKVGPQLGCYAEKINLIKPNMAARENPEWAKLLEGGNDEVEPE